MFFLEQLPQIDFVVSLRMANWTKSLFADSVLNTYCSHEYYMGPTFLYIKSYFISFNTAVLCYLQM